jgi:hypothetical protein
MFGGSERRANQMGRKKGSMGWNSKKRTRQHESSTQRDGAKGRLTLRSKKAEGVWIGRAKGWMLLGKETRRWCANPWVIDQTQQGRWWRRRDGNVERDSMAGLLAESSIRADDRGKAWRHRLCRCD